MARSMKPPIAHILSSMGVSGNTIRKLREESKKYLLLHNHNDLDKIYRLSSHDITRFAREFLTIYGNQYFPKGGSTRLKWPDDRTKLIEQFSRIMFRQRVMLCASHMSAQEASIRETSVDSSDSDSNEERSQESGKKRKATEGAESYRPEGPPSCDQTPKIYPTRRNAQPGMPILPSIEDSNGSTSSLPVNKRLCSGAMSQSRVWRAINSPSLAHPAAAGPSSQPNPVRNNLTINIPIRASTTSRTQLDPAQAPSIPNSPDLPPSAAQHDFSQNTSNSRRPYRLIGIPMVDDFILENHLHLSHTPGNTPAEARPTPEPAEKEIQLCEPTPPHSSVIQDPQDEPEVEPVSISFSPQASAPARDTEERDIKGNIRLSLAHDYPNTIDLTGPDVVEIQTSEDEFRIIHKTRAPRVLQKLLDVFMDELRICRRNARQAPVGQKKRIWEIQTAQLEQILRTVAVDDELWQGGCVSDRTVAML